jgi:hypothetical protein
MKQLQCTYIGEPGESRIAGTKKRMEVLEKLVEALRSRPNTEAEELLSRIRTTDDISSILETRSRVLPDSAAMSASNTSVERSGGSASAAELSRPRVDVSSDCVFRNAATAQHLGKGDYMNSLEVRQPYAAALTANRPVTLLRLLLPDPTVTKNAIISFTSCSGKLFQVFTKEQMDQFYHSIFQHPEISLDTVKSEIGCLMAAAAVGAQYDPDQFGSEIKNTFYNIANYFFVSILEEEPIRAIKVCALLAQYNVFDKNTVAIAHVGQYIRQAFSCPIEDELLLNHLIRIGAGPVSKFWPQRKSKVDAGCRGP